MTNVRVHASKIEGSITVPPSKSHTLRAILFASMAKGTSVIRHFLNSPDTEAMIAAMQMLGAIIKKEGEFLVIQGVAGKPKAPSDVIQCGNSGQVLRFVGALAGLIPSFTVLTGDESIRTNRPVMPLLEGLLQLGALAESMQGNGHAPILIKGPFTNAQARIDGADSQPVSGLLIAAAFHSHPITILVDNPGEKPWVDLTLDWFDRLKIRYTREGHAMYRVEGGSEIEAFDYTVPGDFSTAAFPLVAAILQNTELTLHNMDMDDAQGDKAIIPILQQMGANIVIDASARTLTALPGSKLKGMQIDVNDLIDALPILAVASCFASGKTEIVGAAIARKKESDRISCMARELKKMGANIEERAEGLVIHPSILKGASLETYRDHRMALSLLVASLSAKETSTIHGMECARKTYPDCLKDFSAIGAKIEVE